MASAKPPAKDGAAALLAVPGQWRRRGDPVRQIENIGGGCRDQHRRDLRHRQQHRDETGRDRQQNHGRSEDDVRRDRGATAGAEGCRDRRHADRRRTGAAHHDRGRKDERQAADAMPSKSLYRQRRWKRRYRSLPKAVLNDRATALARPRLRRAASGSVRRASGIERMEAHFLRPGFCAASSRHLCDRHHARRRADFPLSRRAPALPARPMSRPASRRNA